MMVNYKTFGLIINLLLFVYYNKSILFFKEFLSECITQNKRIDEQQFKTKLGRNLFRTLTELK